MDDQEFKQILRDGQAALDKERNRIKNDPRRPRPWEEITPKALTRAIEHIQKEFRTATQWQLSMQVECGCYLALHPELANAPKFKGLQNLIKPELRPSWGAKWQRVRESARFHFWSEEFSDGLKERIVNPFNLFLKIALAQQGTLELPPVEWAKVLANNLIYSLQYTVPHLIKGMCDEQGNRADFDHATFDAYCAWVYWRAPRFIHMEPSGNTLYDRATAWHRESAEVTEEVLRGLTRKMLDPARFKVDKLAGEAYVSLACSVPLRAESPLQDPGPPILAEKPAEVPSEAQTPDRQIKSELKLPTKVRDLSQYLDQAQLTERQRDCISFKLEYGLTTTAIAQHLGLSRKTIDEHVAAAKRRLQLSQLKDKSRRNRARLRPEE
jgi:DNA-directed RNA polymerase specialized sigma24 family protein